MASPVLLRDACSDSVVKIFWHLVLVYGVSHSNCAVCRKMGYRADVHHVPG